MLSFSFGSIRSNPWLRLIRIVLAGGIRHQLTCPLPLLCKILTLGPSLQDQHSSYSREMQVGVRHSSSGVEHQFRASNFASLHALVMANRRFGSGTLENEDGIALAADCGEELVPDSVFVWFPGGYSRVDQKEGWTLGLDQLLSCALWPAFPLRPEALRNASAAHG